MTDQPKLHPENLPAYQRERDQWVCWGGRMPDGAMSKMPINVMTNLAADSTDSSTWSDFDLALQMAQVDSTVGGVGYVFSADDFLTGLDLDNCVNEQGEIHPDARALVDRFASYTEFSPSGRGVHIIIRAVKRSSRCKFMNVYGAAAVEVYDQARYFTMTGRHVEGTPRTIEDRQDVLDELFDELEPPTPRESKRTTHTGKGFDGDDDALIEAASNAKRGDMFRRLWEGDTSEHNDDDSAADLGLCNHLAFWTGSDADRMDRLFRRSGLYREKWDEMRGDQTYGQMTIEKAIKGTREAYSPPRTRAARCKSDGTWSVLIGVDEHRVIDEVVEALSADKELFSRGGALVRVIDDKTNHNAETNPAGAARISLVPTANLRDRLTRAVELMRLDKQDNEHPSHPPDWLVKGVESRGVWPSIRGLSGISEAPFLRPDGTICQAPGYDESTGVLLLPSIELELIPDRPTRQDAIEARDALLHIVDDYLFEGAEHKAAWLAALLTPLARHAFTGPAPLFLVDANVRGAGKGILCQVIGEIVQGRPMPVSSYSTDSQEMRKKITAIAIAGDPLVLLDNVDGVLGHDAIDRALTTTRWRDRILGKSEQIDLPLTSVWYATGNNVQVGADTLRRIIHIRLDVLHERPEDRRDFQHPDLVNWTRRNRARLLRSALTILAAYSAAGRPRQDVRPMGSFEGWSHLVRQAVLWLDLTDPCAGRQRLEDFVDTSREMLGDLLEAIEEYDPENEGFVLGDLIAQLYGSEDHGHRIRPQASRLRTALEQVAGVSPGKVPSSRSVGAKLKSYKRRVVSSRFLDIDPHAPRRGGRLWRIYYMDAGSQQRDEATLKPQFTAPPVTPPHEEHDSDRGAA